MNDLKSLQKRVIDFRDTRDWKQFHNPKDLAVSLVLEAVELMEHFQWKNIEESADHLKNNRGEVAEELADVLYWVLLIANDFDIDLSDALSKKMNKNEVKYPVEKAKGSHRKYTEFAE